MAKRLPEQATIGGLDFTAYAVVTALANEPCWIIHGDYPAGFTCRDVADFAAQPDNSHRYSSEFGRRLINREEMCWTCVAKDALQREVLQ